MIKLILLMIALFLTAYITVMTYLFKNEIMTWIKNFRQEGTYKKRCNDLELENKNDRDAYTLSIQELSKQLTDKQAIIEYKDKTIQLRDKTIRTLKERNKELEENK